MVGHEIGAIAAAAITGAVIISMFSSGSAAGSVISSSLTGFSNLIYAINSPVRSAPAG